MSPARATARSARPDPAALLAWYDRHRRALPWRAGPGKKPDPYRVWLSEIMLQQTTVKAVAPYYAKFLARFPDVEKLAAAELEDVLRLWAGLGYYARARNLHACAQAVAARRRFPETEAELRALPGIGPYTAAAIAAIAFDQRAAPVDGNIERVVARLYALDRPLPGGKPAIRDLAAALTPQTRAGDFAQAMMDLGATICTPKSPACALCPWREPCAARRRGDPETFPVKAAKREGRLRRGAAYVVTRADGCLLVRSRPPKGLLGGMTEVPTSEWSHGFEEARALEQAPSLSSFGGAAQRRARNPYSQTGIMDSGPGPSGRPGMTESWRRIPGAVTHVFTHFPLELVVYAAQVPAKTAAPAGMRWVALADLAGEALPNVMRKVVAHGLETVEKNSWSFRKPAIGSALRAARRQAPRAVRNP